MTHHSKYKLILDNMEWSYSRIRSFSDCPYAWFLHYLLKRDKEEGKFFSQYGSLMHDILAEFHRGKLSAEELASFYLLNFYHSVTGKCPSDKIHSGYFITGLNYLQNVKPPEEEIIGVETELKFEIDGRKFVGIVDLATKDADGKVTLTDHKSRALKGWSRKYPEKKTKGDLVLEEYFRQLYLYAFGWKNTYGYYPDYLQFNCFRNQNVIKMPFDESVMQETVRWALDMIQQIYDTEDFEKVIDFWSCSQLCDYHNQCRPER